MWSANLGASGGAGRAWPLGALVTGADRLRLWGYFVLPLGPSLGLLGLSPGFALLAFWLRQTGWRLPVLMVLLAVLGFNAAQLATRRTMTQLLAMQTLYQT